ncbi:hypothetical protein ARMGADRAFT_774506 [Armillaria gallica]|uniref:Uncharacterized protein n=1 Tax=Armillaria gallica TaxID=47427 RepID=A0A2H3CFD6_ARMGA|nr:hypothetical protein ARMGADRAFT_774506 [Armillaria gallica]
MMRPSSGSFCISMVDVACSTSDVPAILHTIWFLIARLEPKNEDALARWPSQSYHPFLFLYSAFLAHAKLVSIHYLTTIILRRF